MADPNGRGPIGGSTNAPIIDPQTLPRRRQAAPADRTTPLPPGSPPAGLGNAFDVARLLPVLTANGWAMGEKFMRFWIQGNACVAKLDPKLDKATIGANLDNSCMRIYTIPWDWLIGDDRGRGGFAEARDSLRTFREERSFNEAARKQLIKTYGGTPGKFGQFLSDGLAPEKFRDRIGADQVQSLAVSVPHDIARLNDLVAALADFGYYAMYRGETIPVDKVAPRLGELRSLLGSLGLPAGDQALLQALGAKFKALLVVDAVGVYAGDLYEFNGWQYLGNWDLKNQKVWGNWAYAIDSWLFDDTKYGDSVNVENATFRLYRDRTGKGGDFLALTPMKLVPARQLIPVPIA